MTDDYGNERTPEAVSLTPEQVAAWLQSNAKLAAMTTYAPHDCAQQQDDIAHLALRVDNLVDALEYLRRNVDAIRAGAMADLSTVSHQQAAQEGEIAALKVHAKAADMAIERIADAVQALVLRGDK